MLVILQSKPSILIQFGKLNSQLAIHYFFFHMNLLYQNSLLNYNNGFVYYFFFYFRHHNQIVKMKTKSTEKRNCRKRSLFMTQTLINMNAKTEGRARKEQERERGLNLVKETGIK